MSSLTTIPEDQMVTVQEEVITTVDTTMTPKSEPAQTVEEVMDEGISFNLILVFYLIFNIWVFIRIDFLFF